MFQPKSLDEISRSEISKCMAKKKQGILELGSFLPRTVFLGLLKDHKRVVFADVWKKIDNTENAYIEFNQMGCTSNYYNFSWRDFMENENDWMYLLYQNEWELLYSKRYLTIILNSFISFDLSLSICSICHIKIQKLYPFIINNSNFKHQILELDVTTNDLPDFLRDENQWCSICIRHPLFAVHL